MVTKEFYSVKDLIIGSREEYLKNERYLKLLIDLTYSYDKNVKEFYFYLQQCDDRKPELVCKFIQNLKTLRGVIKYLQLKTHNYKIDLNSGRCLKNNNGEYFIIDSEYKAFIKNNDKFTQIAEKILNSDFANKMKFVTNCRVGEVSTMITPSSIYIQEQNLDHKIDFDYHSRIDSIIMSCNNHVINDDLIMHMLESKIPAYILSDYHKQIIDENLSTQKPIEVISETNEKNRVKLLIDEQDDKIILKKVLCKSNIISSVVK